LSGLGLLAVTAVLLLIGAELLTENAAGAARRLQITLFATVFLLAGAEPEELITAVAASARSHRRLVSGSGL
jgi:cation:H+ antiporter